ncbi:hypothetical protein AB0N05_35380 [Nocardia sp. NPDC051030]|uniref:hypothetical protein n=1 Tax=Nocardia sp. NPDC051030 TaxID=3155162 RepID=UPI0034480F9F
MYKPHDQFQRIWEALVEYRDGWDEWIGDELVWDNGLIGDADAFIRGVFIGRTIEVDSEEAARWEACSEIIAANAWLVRSPVHVRALARTWGRLSGRVGELRPYVELFFRKDYRYVADFDDFEVMLRSWGDVVDQADRRGWGLTIEFC